MALMDRDGEIASHRGRDADYARRVPRAVPPVGDPPPPIHDRLVELEQRVVELQRIIG